ncbi:hypothetical protein E3N88_06700 [Mikania micrantha]|uniref:Uncharacterized protein n=1 Tax=Mikania micrantha TaxID=192012 RepID=A0A5N6PPD9_9ASTR|nr:hypothetical protein E3N88_06700 [Mikania micrantha]
MVNGKGASKSGIKKGEEYYGEPSSSSDSVEKRKIGYLHKKFSKEGGPKRHVCCCNRWMSKHQDQRKKPKVTSASYRPRYVKDANELVVSNEFAVLEEEKFYVHNL